MKVHLLILFLCMAVPQYMYAQPTNDSAYITLIQRADSLFAAGNYSKALGHYRTADTIYQSLYTKKMIQESMKSDTPNCGNGGYQKLIRHADSLYATNELQKALKFYERALLIRRDDNYVKSRVTDLKGKLSH